MKSLAIRWRPGQLAQHGANLFGWMLLRAAAQTATVILLARALGAQPYGQVVATVAVASFAVPFVGFGLSHMVLRNAAHDPANEVVYFSRALHWWLRTVLPCATLAIAAALALLPSGLPVIVVGAAIAAEIAATSMIELCARHQQAQQKIHAYGAINVGLPLLRLMALGFLFLIVSHAGAIAVLWVYASSGLLYVLWLWHGAPYEPRMIDTPIPEPMTIQSGLPFSLAMFAMRLQSEFNKPILAQSGFGLAGNYNVAQRAVDMASLPLLALQEALWPRLYAQPNPMRQLRRTGLALMAIALALGTGMWLSAPLLSAVLGASFSGTVAVLRMLAWLPLLQMFRALLHFHAIHHGRMQQIGWAYTLGGTVSVVGVAALVPTHGMNGAVLSGYLTELTVIFFLLYSSWRHRI